MADQEYGIKWYFDDDHDITLAPKRPAGEKQPACFRAFFGKGKAKQITSRPRPDYIQRCAVRINYVQGGSVGKWYSVGKYIMRESANDTQEAFNAEREDLSMANTMAEWKRSGDVRFFKVIISPEFGDQLDLTDLARQAMKRVELDYGPLNWMAVEHHNTDNPHVHIVIRGVNEYGEELRFSRDYIQNGFRAHAEAICTNRLGYRSEENVIEAQEREIYQSRFTGLDRAIQKRAIWQSVTIPAPDRHTTYMRSVTDQNLRRRLKALQDMGLAESVAKDEWRLDDGLEQKLRAMQKTIDRQKMMSAHGVLSSDKDLPFRSLKVVDIGDLAGRVLVHGQEESGNVIRNYMLLESITGEVLRVPHILEIGKARHHGNLQPGSYVTVKRKPSDGDDEFPRFSIEDKGDAELLLSNTEFLRANQGRLAAAIPPSYGGWLGKMRDVVATVPVEAATLRRAVSASHGR